MTLLKVKQGHFETTILILKNSFVYLSSVFFALPNSIRLIQPLNVFKNRFKKFLFKEAFH